MSLSKIVVAYLKKHWLLLLWSLGVIALDIASTLLPPFLLKIIVDSVIPAGDVSALMLWSLYYMLSYAALGILEFLKSVILIQVSQGICKEIRIGLLKRVEGMRYEDLSTYDIGTMESYFNNDVNTINTLVSDGVISMLIDTFKMVGALVSVFFFSLNIGFVVLAISPFITAFVFIVRRRMFRAELKAKEMEAGVNQRVLENIENISAVQTFVAYDYINARYKKILDADYAANDTSMLFSSIFSPVMQMVRYVLIAVIFIISVESPSIFGITIGAFLSISDLLSDLFTPMENIGMELQTLQTSAASIHRINEFIKPRPKENQKPLLSIKEGNYSLLFQNVYYSYNEREKVIQGFSLNLREGEKLTLKGESGVGKSTLFKLAYGLIAPLSGEILINGVSVSLLEEKSRREAFGIVYQDTFFSGGSIKEELTLGESSYSDEEIFSALKKVGLDRVTNLSLPLVEKDYSSGELALFNIARILLRNPPIIFLDEMNAKIDPQTALKIIDILNSFASDKIILSITHYGTQLKGSKELTLTSK